MSALGKPLMSPDRLIYMANQIGKFFQSQGHDKAVPGIAEHIKKFWDPRMRKAIFAHLDSGGTGLDPNVRDALETLKRPAIAPRCNPRRHGGHGRACCSLVPVANDRWQTYRLSP